MKQLYECKVCGSTYLLVYEVNCYDFNTEELYCHSIKIYDSNAVVKCQNCDSEFTVKDYKGC